MTKKNVNNEKMKKMEERGDLALRSFFLRFRDMHPECSRVTESGFEAAVECERKDAVQKFMKEPDVAGALEDFIINCSSLSSFKPQTPLGKFRTYLRRTTVDRPSGERRVSRL